MGKGRTDISVMTLAAMIIGLAGPIVAAAEEGPTLSPFGNKVIGHRGLGEKHSPEPENSVVALDLAFKRGASAVEFDVQLTRDGQLILAHDVVLGRMTTGKGCVAGKSFEEIRGLSLRDGRGEARPESPATLHEAFEVVKLYDDPRRTFLVDLHIKVYDGIKGDWGGFFNHFCPPTDFEALTRKVIEEARAEHLVDRILFTSFDRRVLDLIRKLEPTAKVGLLADYRTTSAIKIAVAAHYDAAAIEYKHVSRKEIELAHRNHLSVFAWSPSKEAEIAELFETYRFDGVITNDLSNALQACAKSCYSPGHEQ